MFLLFQLVWTEAFQSVSTASSTVLHTQKRNKFHVNEHKWKSHDCHGLSILTPQKLEAVQWARLCPGEQTCHCASHIWCKDEKFRLPLPPNKLRLVFFYGEMCYWEQFHARPQTKSWDSPSNNALLCLGYIVLLLVHWMDGKMDEWGWKYQLPARTFPPCYYTSSFYPPPTHLLVTLSLLSPRPANPSSHPSITGTECECCPF